MGIRLHYFVVIENDGVGVGFSASWARRDAVVLEYRKAGHIAQMIRSSHSWAKWLRGTVEYNETLDCRVIQYGKVITGEDLQILQEAKLDEGE